jgi:uncharacterized membrane protein YfcA
MTIVHLVLLGLSIGVLSGTLGIGGGILLVPALMWLTGIEDQRRAGGITLAVLSFPIALPAVVQYYSRGFIRFEDLGRAGWIAVGFALGTYGGAHLVPYLTLSALRLVFGMILLFVAVRFLLTSSSEANAAFYGLIAVGLAWLAYFGLRLLGRRYGAPELGEQIRGYPSQPVETSDYTI